MKEKYQPMFETYVLPNGVALKNRLVMAPMTTFSANSDDTVSNEELAYYAKRSNGVGMVITACIYVQANGKGFDGQFAGDRDEMIPSMKKLAMTIKERGAKAVLQIYHGGKMSPSHLVPNGEPVAPSKVAHPTDTILSKDIVTPRRMTDAEVQELVHAFGETTRRAIEAGFDGVEIHGANGYIIQQFFSPYSNRRTDRWGGSLEKRMSFPLAVIDEVKKVVAEHAKEPFIVGYRLSPEEAEPEGITMKETFALLDAIVETKIDFVHISLGEFWSNARRGVEKIRPRIELIQERVGNKIPVIGVGSIYTPEDALEALEKTGIPLLALGRELIVEPEWVEKIEQGREDEIKTTINKDDQNRLVIPGPLWKVILEVPGWFPVEQ